MAMPPLRKAIPVIDVDAFLKFILDHFEDSTEKYHMVHFSMEISRIRRAEQIVTDSAVRCRKSSLCESIKICVNKNECKLNLRPLGQALN